ncbi:MAG: hypothetical protein IT359_03400 [Gemmatimonadaceae bacterium]|nr:hypothetical protein [Gemmatimonadaceae bacterium]
MMSLRDDWRISLYVALSAAVLLWDVLLAGQIANARRQTRLFLALTSICGLFIVPGALIALAASTTMTGRVVYLVAWLWPVVLLFYVLQSGYALFRRLVTPLFALPIFAFNCTLLAAATARFASEWIVALPSPLVGTAVAQSGALGLIFGRMALWSPWVLALPLLSPAYPARWGVSRSVRAVLALSAATSVAIFAMELPRSVYAAESFAPLGTERLQERPRGDFLLGLHILPTLDAPPAPLPLERDLTLADSLDASIVSVTIAPDGVRALALDSLANALDALRRDSVQLVVTLGYGEADGALYRQGPSRYLERRLAMLDQVVRRLRPDVVIPALDPEDAGHTALGRVAPAWWRDYFTRAAEEVHRLRPRTKVALNASAFTAADSALYAWGARQPGIDLLGFSLAPSFGGGASLEARLRLAERWMRRTTKEQWVFSARGYPRTFGERNQERALWGVVAWATTQPRMRAVIIDGAGDYDTLDGLRAPGGRLRPAATTVARAAQALAESTEGR